MGNWPEGRFSFFGTLVLAVRNGGLSQSSWFACRRAHIDQIILVSAGV